MVLMLVSSTVSKRNSYHRHSLLLHFVLKALAAHAAAEAAVRAQQAQGPGLVGPSGNIGPSGQVGASGNIGPSGLCGPSGCVAFGK